MSTLKRQQGRVHFYSNNIPAYAPDALPFRRATGVPRKDSARYQEHTATNSTASTATNSAASNSSEAPAALDWRQQDTVDTVRQQVEYLSSRICEIHHPEVIVLGVTAGMDTTNGVIAVDIALSHTYPEIGTVTLHDVTAHTTTQEAVDLICGAVAQHLLQQ